ncbi:MAG: hypothetical protein M9916_10010 [Crocinitomicaceae bacterium]|nr:hypothetical protein [Crocinitomicaceae bacterium]
MKPIKFSKLKLFLLTITCLPLLSNAQDTITKDNTFIISAQIRPRAEIRSGNFKPAEKGKYPAALISQRTRLKFFYDYKDILSVNITPQMISIWGQDGNTQGSGINNGFALFEAWAKVHSSKTTYFAIGRQIISLDDERYFGELDWAQGARVHDALSFHWEAKKVTLRTYLAYNQNYKALYSNNINNISGNLYSPVGATPYKWMQTIWGNFKITDIDAISLLASNIGFQTMLTPNDTAKNYNNQTFGVNYFHTGAKWNINASAYYQMGQNAGGKRISAYMAVLGASYKFNDQWKLGFGSELVSGNKVGAAPKSVSNVFTPYFITGHKFYGHMDYYYAGNGHKDAGLSDNFISLGYAPSQKWSLYLNIHQFLAPYGVNNGIKDLSINLGQEFDLGFNVKINKFVKIYGGYSLYMTTPTVNNLKGSINPRGDQHWGWVTLDITPVFLNLKH